MWLDRPRPDAQTSGGLGRSKYRAVQAGRTEGRSARHISGTLSHRGSIDARPDQGKDKCTTFVIGFIVPVISILNNVRSLVEFYDIKTMMSYHRLELLAMDEASLSSLTCSMPMIGS
jgi:hypothetical protein